MSDERPKSRRGFAAMDRAKQRAIASQGGVAAHKYGVAHEWTADEARRAGMKGGSATRSRRKLRGPLSPEAFSQLLRRSGLKE